MKSIITYILLSIVTYILLEKRLKIYHKQDDNQIIGIYEKTIKIILSIFWIIALPMVISNMYKEE